MSNLSLLGGREKPEVQALALPNLLPFNGLRFLTPEAPSLAPTPQPHLGLNYHVCPPPAPRRGFEDEGFLRNSLPAGGWIPSAWPCSPGQWSRSITRREVFG